MNTSELTNIKMNDIWQATDEQLAEWEGAMRTTIDHLNGIASSISIERMYRTNGIRRRPAVRLS